MKSSCYVLFALFCLMTIFACATTKIASNAVTLQVEYKWLSSDNCSSVSPEIKVSGIPASTKQLKMTLTDLDVPSYNHGGGTVDYKVSKGKGPFIIPRGALKGYTGPCPPSGQHRYSFKVDAIDANGVIVGFGKKAVSCCP